MKTIEVCFVDDLLAANKNNQTTVALELDCQRQTVARYIGDGSKHFIVFADGEYKIFTNKVGLRL